LFEYVIVFMQLTTKEDHHELDWTSEERG
ncbi:MAG: hypothetical protein H6Q05_5066, partial [Acidobacteria bacterium]|nr:hypothetical protein [Acidobacteriota bacterium]